MSHRIQCFLSLVLVVAVSLLLYPTYAAAQDQDPKSAARSEHGHRSDQVENSLAEQLRELQTKVAKLEAALKQNHQAKAADAADASSHSGHKGKMQMGGMQGGSMQGKGMMNRGMMGGQMGMMPGMSSMQSNQAMSGMSDMGGMKMMEGDGMSMMGRMKRMGSMQMASALPGFPGASHIYHIGSTNFFLDHPQHITLTQEQQTKLNQMKEQTLLGQATFDRWIDAGEQELWVLTSADAPDASKIEAKVREIEKLRGDKRIAFIRAVGEAAKVLTDEQRKTLIGTLPADHTAAGTSGQH
ncbi:MAG: hypothetical protein DWQ31_17605 [Planctomycetota bacterium]|nr:MAG: hypothetical protein DWQ31_17605 [Planctomycetota bacterium]REJ92166.1 MAG: hypothetical protein DWQ35_13555 [Planctomycetota bacterium]REK28702.1 MAG: hypothetical protein DWQ42_05145 [Planctomycetota bacterium]REK39316.1 MAG: hypothetical protein DWQ46_18725 [Planctomycetota bacterium]